MNSVMPKFPIYFPVKIGYLGLYRADADATNRAGEVVHLGYAVRGLRLVPEPHEDEDGLMMVGYPNGWEYLIARVVPATDERCEEWRESGWYPEAELLAKGYAPPANPAG